MTDARADGGDLAGKALRTTAVAGLWLGGAGGLLEAGWTAARRLLAGRLVFVPEFYWLLAPAVNALVVAAAALAVVAVFPARWHRARFTASLAVPLMLATAGVLLVPGRLHWSAIVLLSAGIGLQGERWLRHRWAPSGRLALATLPVVVVLAPMALWAGARIPRSAPSAAEPARTGLPNVLLIVLDTVRGIELSLYRGPATTATLDRLGRSGVVFEHAMSTAPWTLPAHGSLFTGRWAHELSTDYFRPLDRTFPTVAETLAKLGYATAGFVANTEYASLETGLARGFGHFEDHRLLPGTLARLTRLSRMADAGIRSLLRIPPDLPNRVHAVEINRRALGWLRRQRGRPFFAFLNYYDAHAPYYPPPAEWRRFVGDRPRTPLGLPLRAEGWEADSIELRHRAYRASIAGLDAAVGHLIDSLRAQSMLENTLVIVTSDHGEEFDEHGVMGHGNSLYLPGVQVPLVMAWPERLPEGCRIAAPVTLRELPATIADLIGGEQAFPGRSLARFWTDRDQETEPSVVHTSVTQASNLPGHYPASQSDLVAAQWGPLRVLARVAPEPQVTLFDHRTDPMELTDLSGAPWAGEVVDDLLDSLVVAGALPEEIRDEFDAPAGPASAGLPPAPEDRCPTTDRSGLVLSREH